MGLKGEGEVAAPAFDDALRLEEGGEEAGDDAVGAEVGCALLCVMLAGEFEGFVLGEGVCEGVGVDEGEVDALAEVGAHGVGGVAEEEAGVVVGVGHVDVVVGDELEGVEGVGVGEEFFGLGTEGEDL